MKTSQRNRTYRFVALAAFGAAALACGGAALAQPDEMLVTATAPPAAQSVLAAEIDAAMSEARLRLKQEVRMDLAQFTPQVGGGPLQLSELARSERG